MARKKAEETAVESSGNLGEQTTTEGTPINPPSIVETPPKSKKVSQKEPYKYIDLVIDVGRSTAQAMGVLDGEIIEVDKIPSCVFQSEAHPENDRGGFTLELQIKPDTPIASKDEIAKEEKPKPIKTEEHWIVGNRAIDQTDCIWFSAHKDHKVKYFHVELMGILSILAKTEKYSTGKNKKQQTLTVNLNPISIAHQSDLLKELKNCKSIIVAGTRYKLNFTNQRQYFKEGHGAAVLAKKMFPDLKYVYVVDLGEGTFQIRRFNITSNLPDEDTQQTRDHGGGGIYTLKKITSKALAQNGDSATYTEFSKVAKILETSKWIDEQVAATDFTGSDVSKQITLAITTWLRDSPAEYALDYITEIARDSKVIFCGGGFEIKSVQGMIKKKILATGCDENNLVFPANMDTVSLRGVIQYLHPELKMFEDCLPKEKIISLVPSTETQEKIDHDNQQQAATA